MTTVRGIHDPVELARYGLPEGVWAWLIEPDAADLSARGVDAALYAVTVLGIDRWPGGPEVGPGVDYPDARKVALPGLVEFDVRYLSVRLLGTPAELIWLAPPDMEPRIDLLRVQGLRNAQVLGLYGARRLVDLNWGSALGRPRGDTDLSMPEFERRLRKALDDASRLNLKPNQGYAAGEIGINVTTLRKYLRLAGVRWRTVIERDWPPR